MANNSYHLSRPALSKEIKGRVTRALSNADAFESVLGADNTISRQSFSKIMASQQGDLHLTPRESGLVFDNMVGELGHSVSKGNWKSRSGSIGFNELQNYAKEHHEEEKKKKSFIEKVRERASSMQEASGYGARDDIAEQNELANEHAQNLNSDPNGEINSYSMPSMSLGEFPGLHLPEGVDPNFQLPSFLLGDFPGLNLDHLTLKDIGTIVFPSIEIGRFPGLGMLPDLPSLKLPSLKLPNFPNVVLPDFPNTPEFPNVDIPNIHLLNIPNIRVPQIKIDIGGSLMKLKLFLGFVQCVSFFPVTFSTISFPTEFLNLGNYLQVFNVDLFALFGTSACDFGTGFYQSFMFSFLLFPLVIGGALISYGAVRLFRKYKPSKAKYTTESARTRLYTFLFMIVYSLYTGVATKMFLLFKCEKIQGVWYLMADYRIVCFDATYNFYRNLAVLGIVVYVFGILLGILGLLVRNKMYLHESNCPPDELYKHLQMVKQFGSIYGDYTENNFYFDLVDLARRLLLTGGLILIGEQSNTQIFLGALLCFLWLMLVTIRRPYEAYWDNVLSIVLSSQLVLIMLCGMALEMNRLTPELASDPYEKSSFGALMVAFSIIIIMTAIAAMVISIPCLRDRMAILYAKKCDKPKSDDDEDEDDKDDDIKNHKKRRLSSRELMKQNSGEEKNPEIELTAISIKSGSATGDGGNITSFQNPNWKKLKQHVKVANAFKSNGKKNINRSKSNGKKNVRRLSKVMKSRRNSATIKKDGVSKPHIKQLLKEWFSECNIPLTDETFQILDEIGVENSADMKELDDDDINNVCSTLQNSQAKRLRKALEPSTSK